MTVKTSQKCPVCTFGSTDKNRQLTDFDLYSYMYMYLPLKCSYCRRVQLMKPAVKRSLVLYWMYERVYQLKSWDVGKGNRQYGQETFMSSPPVGADVLGANYIQRQTQVEKITIGGKHVVNRRTVRLDQGSDITSCSHLQESSPTQATWITHWSTAAYDLRYNEMDWLYMAVGEIARSACTLVWNYGLSES